MGKYMGSPWGFIRGKIGDTVGGAWKGVDWCRVRILPTQRGTLDLYRQLKDGLIQPERFSYPQMNIRRCVTQILGYIARRHYSSWCQPVWAELVAKRGWTMNALDAFVKRNASRLLNSMPDKAAEFDASTNAPDLSEMLMADGDLEPATLDGAPASTYDPGTGAVTINFNGDVFENGDGTDVCQVVIAKKPLLESVGRDGTWYPALFLYPHLPAPLPPAIANVRSDEQVNITIPPGLTASDLTAYLFFRDYEGIIGYSPSIAVTLT